MAHRCYHNIDKPILILGLEYQDWAVVLAVFLFCILLPYLSNLTVLSLAVIVRGADTAGPDLTPQAEGLLAASLGFSRMYKDVLAQLDASMALYDAFYRCCRDAHAETHDWPSTKTKA